MVKNINEALCIGCGVCTGVCAEDVLRLDEVKKKAYVKYPKDCVGCSFCEVFCPVGAIATDSRRPRKMPEVL
jgi:adenylylsulfate reductase subunit B